MRINYIIASYGGYIKSREGDLGAEYVLQNNLTCLYHILSKKEKNEHPNYISQVTIVCPPIRQKVYENYYNKEYWLQEFKNISNTELVYLDYKGPNKHASYDQWIQACQKYTDFDYNILCEDDYTMNPGIIDFDSKMVEIYREKLPNNIGYLCSLAGSDDDWSYHARISNGMISKETVSQFEGKMLDNYYTRPSYHCQIQFSLLFQSKGIPIVDYSEYYANKFYRSELKDIIDFSNSGKTIPLFIPVQMIKK